MLKIARPDAVAKIPQAPLKASDISNCSCLDEIAARVIVEALDFALESSARKLSNLGKIWPEMEMTAYGDKEHVGILPIIRGIREAILEVPTCPVKEFVMPAPMSPLEAAAANRTRIIQAERAERKTKKTGTKPAETKAASKEVLAAFTTEEEAGLAALPAEQREQVRAAMLKGKTRISELQQEVTVKKTKYQEPFVRVMDASGALLRWEDADGKALPRDLWPKG